MELKERHILFVYTNQSLNNSLFDIFYIPLNLSITDGQWHSFQIKEKNKKLHLIINEGKNSINFTLLNPFSIERFSLDYTSKILLGRTLQSHQSFKVNFFLSEKIE